MAVSNDDGLTFLPASIVSKVPYNVPVSRIVAHKDKVALVVSEGHDFGRMTLITSTDGGISWSSQIISEKGTAGTPLFSPSNQLYLVWTAVTGERRLQLESFYSVFDQELNVRDAGSLTGPYEIEEEVSYLGVYQGIGTCRGGASAEFTIIRWTSHLVGKTESYCL